MLSSPIYSQDLVIWALRTYFIATSISVLIARNVPALRRTFIPYGKTRTGNQPSSNSLLRQVAEVTVPKSWFWHYYLVSVSLSIFWATQFVICARGHHNCIMCWLATLDGRSYVLWTMMALQGSRRLYESTWAQKPSAARMWIGHYIVGIAFYVAMSVSVFAENLSRPTSSTPHTMG